MGKYYTCACDISGYVCVGYDVALCLHCVFLFLRGHLILYEVASVPLSSHSLNVHVDRSIRMIGVVKPSL